MRTHTSWITLQKPIERDGQEPIRTLRLRRPKAGDMRGQYLTNVLRMDATAMLELIPKLAEPYIVADEAEAIDIADLVTISSELIGFFIDPAGADELTAAD